MSAGTHQEGAMGTIGKDGIAVGAGLAELGLDETLGAPQIGATKVRAEGGGFVEACAGEVGAFEIDSIELGVLQAAAC